jgi:HlyD family secretion protein
MQQHLIEKKPLPVKLISLVGSLLAAMLLTAYTYFNTSLATIPSAYQQAFSVQTQFKNTLIHGLGSIVAPSKIIIAVGDEGRIAKLAVRKGQQVNKGDLLAQVTNYSLLQLKQNAEYELADLQAETVLKQSDLLLDKYKLEANLAKLHSELKKQQLELNANKTLVKTGIVSSIKYQQAQMNYEQLQLDVDLLNKQLTLFNNSYKQQIKALKSKVLARQKKLDYIIQRIQTLTIIASEPGIVSEINIDVGQAVTQGQSLFELIDTSKLIAKIHIPQYSSNKLSTDLAATIITPNGNLSAKVEYIDTVIRNGSVSVYLAFTEQIPKWIKLDQAIEAQINSDQQSKELFINYPHKLAIDQQWLIYLKNHNKVNKLTSQYKQYADNNLVIQSDKLQQGDIVYLLPQKLADKNQYALN